MKKNVMYRILCVGLISVQALRPAGEQIVNTALKTSAPSVVATDVVPCGSCCYWEAIKNNPRKTVLGVALAATAIAFWAVYDNDKSFMENVQNFPNNLWIRLNNAIVGAQTKKKCY